MRLPTFYEQNLIPNWGSIYSEFNATFATNEIITITSPTLAMSITS